MKQFHVHRFLPPGKLPNRTPRGFTATITPSSNPGHVFVGVGLCSPKDNFCRKTGRQMAALSEQKEVRKTDVPRLLSALAIVCGFGSWTEPEEWFYVYKYMLE